MQSRKMSLVESLTNITVGFSISFVITGPVLALFGLSTDYRQDFLITLLFTVTSLARSYLLRRVFNRMLHR